jgi:hypothetical protein
MTEADRAAFAELLLRLDTVYEKKPSKIRAEEYWRAFLPVPIGALRDAVSIHMQASDRFPRISTLHAIVARVQTQHATRALPPPTIEIDGDRAYSCLHCRDTGWQLANGNGIESDTDRPPGKAHTVTPCYCPRGQAHREARHARSHYQLYRPRGFETEG